MNCKGELVEASHTSLDPTNTLCAVCQQIDFALFTQVLCDSELRSHFHLSEWKELHKRKFCPGCRLILSTACMKKYHDSRIDDMDIKIRQKALEVSTQYFTDSPRSLPVRVAAVHTESLLEIVLHNPYSHVPNNEVVIGAILRKFCSDAADSTDRRPLRPGDKSRPRDRAVQQEVDIGRIKEWIRFCNIHHNCQCPPSQVDPLQHRVRFIDVRDYKIVWGTLRDCYVTLSYVWGKKTMPLLLSNNLTELSRSGSLNEMSIPKTISDAIELVRELGERYLWVDTLCIAQNDMSDKKQQLSIMGKIFTCASFTIVTADGCDANAGLPGFRGTIRSTWQHTEEIEGIEYIIAPPPLQQALEQSVWNTRGWTCQEAILSRRALVFANEQIYWSCRVDGWREDLTSEWVPTGLSLNGPNTIWDHAINPYQCRTKQYCEIVETFSSRTFTDDKDAFWAFAGILDSLLPRFPQGFIWGIPFERLDAALLWTENTDCPSLHTRGARHPLFYKGSSFDLPYPSWSWLSTKHKVVFADRCGNSLISEIVAWNEPVKLTSPLFETYMKASSGQKVNNSEDECLVAKNPAFSNESHVMECGLLCATVHTALLILRKSRTAQAGRAQLRNPLMMATVHLPDGDVIGTLTLPVKVFESMQIRGSKFISRLTTHLEPVKSKRSRRGEFVLLSSNVKDEYDHYCKIADASGLDCGKIDHIHDCNHVVSRNVMLIERSGDIAYRRGLFTVKKEDWRKAKVETKTIVLG